MTKRKPFVFMAAALAENGGIGYGNGLPWSIPGDWMFFENITTKSYGDQKRTYNDATEWTNTIIIGRRSYESRPMCSVPLFNRYNIVVSSNPEYKVDHSPICELVTSLDEALDVASKKVKEDGRIFLLGGEQIYRQGILLPECTHVLITDIYSSKHIDCDTFIPEIDPNTFRRASHDELEAFLKESVPRGYQTHEHFKYKFVLHIRKTL